MKNGIILLWITVFAIVGTSAYAADGCITGENCTWWLYTTSSGDYYDTDHANITLYYPNETLYKADVPMYKVDTGRFKYVEVHNTTGNWLGCMAAYNTTEQIGVVCESKEMRNEIMSTTQFSSFVLIGALAVFIFALLYFAFQLEKEHGVLQLFLIYMANIMFVIVGYVTTTLNIAGSDIFYNATLFLFIIFNIYVIIKFGHTALEYIKKVVPR